MKNTLIKQLVNKIITYKNCIDHNNITLKNKAWDEIQHLLDKLPLCGRIDEDYAWEYNDTEGFLKLFNRYHVMNDNGYYTHWINYKVIIKPDFISDINIKIVGNFKNYQSIKDYLYDVYYNSLISEE